MSAVAWGYGNPFNGLAFAMLSVVLAVIAVRPPRETMRLGDRWAVLLGVGFLLFAWVYPHFLVDRSPSAYLYGAPLGITPCPTLALVIAATDRGRLCIDALDAHGRSSGRLLFAFRSTASRRRVRMPPQYLSLSGGYALSTTPDGGGPFGEGFLLQGEYILVPSEWFSPRAYVGTLMTFGHSDATCSDAGVRCDISAKIGFLGVKGRLTVPIPLIAPFLELGLGASIGTMTTRATTIDERMAGVTYHVPIVLGLALGDEHQFEIAFMFLEHPSVRQSTGGFYAGVTFRIHE